MLTLVSCCCASVSCCVRWPNYNKARSGHGWPQCCQSKYGSDIDPSVVSALLPELQLYWPNEQDPSGGDLAGSLWGHEWGKHGTCSGLPQRTYLETAMALQLGMPTPPAITNNIGGSVSLSELKAAFNATSCRSGGECMVGFSCTKQNGGLYLNAVTTCFDLHFNQIPCSASVLGSQGHQCTDDKVYILSF